MLVAITGSIPSAIDSHRIATQPGQAKGQREKHRGQNNCFHW